MVDITVRGAGIFGLSVAWACLQRGATVRVIERAHPGAGCSGGLVGALSPHVPETWNPKKAFQLASLLMAEAWWAEVDSVSGLSSGHARVGRLQPLADDKAVASAHRRAGEAAILWQGRAEWRVIPATGAAWEPLSPSGWLVQDTLSALISPRHALASLVAALRAKGGEILSGDAAEAGLVVHATGVQGLADLSVRLGKRVGTGVKGQAASLRFAAPAAPQLFVDGLHVVPHADGTVAVGSTSETVWENEGPDGQVDSLIARAVAAVPALAAAPVLERWAGIRPRASSRAPILGPWPGRPGHFIANGGFKIGFGMAPKVAEVMADLLLDGRDFIPDGFRVEASL